MRKIKTDKITELVAGLCIQANTALRKDVLDALINAGKYEKNRLARRALDIIIENAKIAKREKLAICQDTGMAVIFVRIGKDAQIVGGDLKEAINKGVINGYRNGFLRKSVVGDPFSRKNTKTNAPAVIHIDVVSGKRFEIIVSPKGFGSENKSQIRVFKPTDDITQIKKFIIDVVKQAGPDACPPFILGIGIGGTFEKAAELSKEALLLPIGRLNPDRLTAKLQKDLMKEINNLNIGPMGFGGKTTCLGVNILAFPTHIAGMPVAVNVSCHATRTAWGKL